MTPDTQLLIIHLLEGITDGFRRGSFILSDAEGRRVLDALKNILCPQPKMMRICNISQACDYLGISQPTFRKYVRQGKIPQGRKVSGFTELIWDKGDIEKFKKDYDDNKKRRKRV